MTYRYNKKIKKTMKNPQNPDSKTQLGGGGAPMDLQGLTQQDIEGLMQQGIMPEQIAQLAAEQGQPIPPIVQQMMSAEGAMPPDMAQQQQMGQPMGPEQQAPPSKTSKFPAMMDLPTYAQYKDL